MSLLTSNSDVLEGGENYTFTYTSGKLFSFKSDSDLEKELRFYLQNFGSVLSVDRPLFSGRLAVSVVPEYDTELHEWLKGFDYAWKSIGYDEATFVQAEYGGKSTKPGGFGEAIPAAAGAISSTLGNTISAGLKPLIPYIVVVVGILLYFEYTKRR